MNTTTDTTAYVLARLDCESTYEWITPDDADSHLDAGWASPYTVTYEPANDLYQSWTLAELVARDDVAWSAEDRWGNIRDYDGGYRDACRDAELSWGWPDGRPVLIATIGSEIVRCRRSRRDWTTRGQEGE